MPFKVKINPSILVLYVGVYVIIVCLLKSIVPGDVWDWTIYELNVPVKVSVCFVKTL